MKAAALFFCALAATACANKLFHGNQVLRTFPNEEQREFLISIGEEYDFDFWDMGPHQVDIHVPRIYTPIVKVLLARNSIEYEIFIEDLQASIDGEREDYFRPQQMDLASYSYNVYHTFDEIDAWIDNMASAYPSLISLFTVGTSYEGQAFRGLKFSAGSNNPAFYINCGLHAREWVGPATCMYVAKWLAEAQPGSDEYTMLQSVDIYLTPISNPDGYKYTWNGDRMWRKTRSDNNKRCMGVDPNRNWDVNWSGEGASSNPCNDAYYGPSVWSEVEVTAQRDMVMSISNVGAYIDVHAYSQLWMYPYGYTVLPTADATLLEQIGQESVAAIKAVHGETYETGQISRVIYQASGSSADWFYMQGIKCAWAAELRDTGRYGFTLPERFIQPTAEETWAGLKVIASYIQTGQC